MWMRMLSTDTSMRFFILGSILALGPPPSLYLNALPPVKVPFQASVTFGSAWTPRGDAAFSAAGARPPRSGRCKASRVPGTLVPKGRRGRLILIDAHSLIYRAFFALP